VTATEAESYAKRMCAK